MTTTFRSRIPRPLPRKRREPKIIVNVPTVPLNVPRATKRSSSRASSMKKGFSKFVTRQQMRNYGSGFDFDKVFRELFTTFTRALSNPSVILSILVTVAFVVSHDLPNKKGFIYDTFTDRTDNVSKWITSNVPKIVGGLIFLPSLFDLPHKYRSMLMMSVVAWVALVPEYSILEYTVQSIALHTFFKVRSNHAKMFIIGAAVVAYFFGFISLPRVSVNGATPTTTPPVTTTARVVPKG